MKRLRIILVNLLVAIVSLVVGLFMVEVGVRVLGLYRFPAADFIQPHPELGWSHIPDKNGYWTVGKQTIPVKINSKGLRDVEYSYEKREGTFRILVLGDSFTEGFQVSLEDTFCKVLERELNKGERRFEVINAGFAGVGTDYELLFFRREGYKYHPNLVILAFFANDVYENYRSKDVLDDANAPIAYERKGLVTHVKKILARHSCGYNYFGYVLPRHTPLFAKFLMRIGLLSSQPIESPQGVKQLHYLIFGKTYGSELKRAWRLTKKLIIQLIADARNHGSELAVVSIPFREQVYENLWRSTVLQPGMAKREWDLNKPDQILSEFLSDEDIPFLQLLPSFRKVAGNLRLYYFGADGHWNVQGHQLAGQVIYNWLVEEKLVPFENQNPKAKASL